MGKGVWGIDVSKYSIKAARIEKGPSGYLLTSAKVFPFRGSDSGEPGGSDEQIKETLQEVKTTCRIGSERVVVSLPGHSTFNRLIKLPPVDDEKLAEVVKYEAQSQIPFNIDEVIWAYQFVQRPYGPGEEKEVILFAIKKDLVESFLNNIAELGLNIDAVQFGPIGLYNFLGWDQEPGGSAVALDMGADNTDLIILDGPKFWIRNLPITGNDLTKALQKSFNIPFAEAEKLKLKAGQSQQAQKIFNAVQQTLRDLVSEVQRSIGYYKSISKTAKFEKIYLLGNSTKTLNFQRFVSQNLQMPAVRVAKLNRLTAAESIDQGQLNEDLTSLGTALGLALQGWDETPNRINLLPEVYHRRKELKKKQPFLIGAMAALYILVGLWGFNVSGEAETLRAAANRAQGVKAELTKAQADLKSARESAQKIKCLDHERCSPDRPCAGPLDKIVAISVERDLALKVMNLIAPNIPDNGDRSGKLKDEERIWIVDWTFEEKSIKPATSSSSGFGMKAASKPLALDRKLEITIEGVVLNRPAAGEIQDYVVRRLLGWNEKSGAKASDPSVVDQFKLRRGGKLLNWVYQPKDTTSHILPQEVLTAMGVTANEGDNQFARFVVTLSIPVGERNRDAAVLFEEAGEKSQGDAKAKEEAKGLYKRLLTEFSETWVVREYSKEIGDGAK